MADFGSSSVVERYCVSRTFKRQEARFPSMNESHSNALLSFRVHFIRMRGPDDNPTVRMLLVETTEAQTVYEGFGYWLQCKGWVAQLSGYDISRDQLATVQRSLNLKRLATIQEIWTSLHDLDSVGFRRVDS